MLLRRALVAVLSLAAPLLCAACPHQEVFPRCDDPAHPCPPVDPCPLTDPSCFPGPGDVVTEDPDDSPAALASPCGRACANLLRVGCPEGKRTAKGVTCYRGCVSQARDQRLPTACWAGAASPGAARACGALRCPAP